MIANKQNVGFEVSLEMIANGEDWLLDSANLHYLLAQAGESADALKVMKRLKKREIDRARDEAINSGVSYKNKTFQSGEKDRNLLTSTTSLFSITKQVPDGFVWISKDNEAVPFTLEDLIALGGVMAISVNQNTIKARELKDRVERARTKAEIEAVVWG